MAASRRLIVVSNRGPVSYARADDGSRVGRRGGGGLVTALRGLVAHHDVTWIASAMSDEDRVVAAEAGGEAFEERSRDGRAYRLKLVAHERQSYDWFYNVVANPALWFVQHHLWEADSAPAFDARFERAWEDGYARANDAFAAAVGAELERTPDARVLIHDYHLYLAPRRVRERFPRAALAHFTHIPWPGPEQWKILPDAVAAAIHDGLLACDVVGFHAARWRRNFLRAAEEILAVSSDFDDGTIRAGDRRIDVSANPGSIDPAEFEELARSDDVLAAERELVADRPEHLILRVDRTDPSKNIVRGFQAFELYLEEHPQMHGRVAMLALLDPSRQDIPEYRAYLAEIEAAARTVNTRFGRADWLPVDLRIEDNFPEVVASYKQFDVLLVNPAYDGLNLVAKEAPLVNGRNGVVVLSENAGAYEELGEWVVGVDPFDVADQAGAIARALEMEEDERRRRLEAIRAHVREHDVARWLALELAALEGRSEALRG